MKLKNVQGVISAYQRSLQLRLTAGEYAPASLGRAKHYLDRFAARFGAQTLKECSRHDLTVFLAEGTAWKSNHTKTDALGTILACFRWAEEEELIDHTPYRRPRGLRMTCRPRTPMTRAQYVSVMRAAGFHAGDRRRGGDAVPLELVQLRHGPYRAPEGCGVGQKLACAVRGLVQVDGLHHGAIAWPFTQQRSGCSLPGPHSLIVAGDLARALKQEHPFAIAAAFGVSIRTVLLWLQKLNLAVPAGCFARRGYRVKRASALALRRGLFFLRRTGCRTCEMRAMRWSDIDWAAGVVRLVEHKTAHVTGDVRTIGLDPACVRFLANLQRQAPASQAHVLVNGRGRPWTKASFAALFHRYASKVGVIGASPYGLRHMFCLTGIENGVGERQIADQLGHSTTALVGWYGRQARSRAGHLRNVVSQVMNRKRGGVA